MVQQYKIKSIAELLKALDKVNKGHKTVWYRGHGDHRWHLEPTLSRCGKLLSEIQFIKQFKQNAFQFLERVPESEADWIFLMQHYGVPTRLLDWTESPLIALFFALTDPGTERMSRRPDAAVWCLYPRRLNEMSGIVLIPPDDIPALGDEPELNDYLPSRVHAQGNVFKNPVAIVAPRKFGRVYAQQGVFTVLHRECVKIDEMTGKNNEQGHLVKLIIPRSAAHGLLKELKFLGIHKLSVFPQLENVALKIREEM